LQAPGAEKGRPQPTVRDISIYCVFHRKEEKKGKAKTMGTQASRTASGGGGENFFTQGEKEKKKDEEAKKGGWGPSRSWPPFVRRRRGGENQGLPFGFGQAQRTKKKKKRENTGGPASRVRTALPEIEESGVEA